MSLPIDDPMGESPSILKLRVPTHLPNNLRFGIHPRRPGLAFFFGIRPCDEAGSISVNVSGTVRGEVLVEGVETGAGTTPVNSNVTAGVGTLSLLLTVSVIAKFVKEVEPSSIETLYITVAEASLRAIRYSMRASRRLLFMNLVEGRGKVEKELIKRRGL